MGITFKLKHIIYNPINYILSLLLSSSSSDTTTTNNNNNGIKLAFQQKLTTYTKSLPIHEQNALFLSTPIRGCSNSNHILNYYKDCYCNHSNSKNILLSGISEIRFPVLNIPIKEYNFNIHYLLFHDWSMIPSYSYSSSWKRKYSFGIGLRK